MSHTPHELVEEFPEHVERIRALKQSNAHFAKLAEAYHEINRSIHRAEARIEPVDGMTEEGMRKQRLHLKDQIYAMIAG
ncbi:MAG: YdcH family protein [Hyphomicrobiales bacterium]|nr:YdcH family protein [Hyphomicrobiales bacterium]